MKNQVQTHRRARRFTHWGLAALGGGLLAGPAWAADEAAPAKEDAEPAKEEAKAEEEEEAKEETAPEDLLNWFSVSVGGLLTDGDQAAAKRRLQRPADAFGGVEDFHYEQTVGKKGLFKADGRGIFDNHDYKLSFELSHPEIGFVRGGYREYRTWHDGSGGFFPATDAWYSLYDEDLALDRGAVWFQGGLTLPKLPQLTLGYRHEFRDGLQDSTSWGLSTQAGAARGIVPSFLDIDEQRDLFTTDLKHTAGKTALELGVSYELGDQDNRRNERQFPGERGDSYVTQKDGVDSDLFNLHASSETRFNDKTLFTAGYAYTDLDNDFTGYRVYGSGYDPDFANRLPSPSTFDNLSGGSQLSQHVVNLNLMVTPWKPLVVVPSVRIEKQDTAGMALYELPATPLSPNPYQAGSDRGLLDVSEQLEVRYTGVTNWVFYARGNWLQGSGDLVENWDNLGTTANVAQRSTDDDRLAQKYSVGAKWYPLRRVNVGAEYYHKERNNDYEHGTDSTPNDPGSSSRYPAFLTAQDFTTDDFNLRATWRPRGNVTLVGRYDLQFSTIESQMDGLDALEAADMTSHVLSGSATWTPFNRLYLQGSLSYVMDQTDTPADQVTSAILDSDNDYWTASVSAGYALDQKTDLEVTYFYYRADNYVDNSPAGVPYGAGIEEHGVTAGLVRRLTPRLRWTLKYGFYTSADELSGGYNDFDAHLIYSSVQYRF